VSALDGHRFPELTRERSLADKVADAILERIVSNALRPGEPLPSERHLAEQFNVSRTVVREAVRTLSGKGILDVQSGRNIRVAAVSAATVRESMDLFLRSGRLGYDKLSEVRGSLETEIAGLAAMRATPAQIAELERLAARMEEIAADVEQAAHADVAFHRAIAASTENELYVLLLDSIGGALVEIRREVLAAPLTRPHGNAALRAHRRILACIAAHDRQGARRAMREHLAEVDRMWTAARDASDAVAGTGGQDA
jgi:GntR family transcriptional repressor for pyruvate dehydrogenase complex